MAKEYLDKTGLAYFWGKIKAYVTDALSGVADDHKWNDVELNKTTGTSSSRVYIPQLSTTSGVTATLVSAYYQPTAHYIAKFDASKHMNSEDMSASDVTDFVDSLSGTPIAPAVYCTEVGNSNGWHYKKYSDGYGEAWYRGSKSLAHYNTINGFYAYGYNEINLPFTMANNTYQCDADFLIGNGFAFGTSVRKSTTQLTNLFALATTSGTQTVYLNAHIYGVLA